MMNNWWQVGNVPYGSMMSNQFGYCDPYAGTLGYNPNTQFYPYQLFDSCQLNGRVVHARNLFDELQYERERKRELKPRKFEKDNYTGVWTLTERNSTRVTIGKLKIVSCVFVYQHGLPNYSALYCVIETENGRSPVVIPQKKLFKLECQEVLQYFSWNPDCSLKYYVMLFYKLLAEFESKESKILTLPKRSGWVWEEGGTPQFFFGNLIDPYIREYYPKDILERRMIITDKPLMDIAKEYAANLPKNWKYKLLVAIRIASLLLFFFKEKELEPKQMFVLQPASDPNAELIIALTRTLDYTDTASCSLTLTPTKLRDELDLINDGTVVFKDNALVEDRKQLAKNLTILQNDLQKADGRVERSRHLIIVVSKNPGNLGVELPAFYLGFQDSEETGNIKKLQELSGQFDFALINAIMKDHINNLAILDNSIRESCIFPDTILNSERIETMKLIYSAACLLQKYGIVDHGELNNISNWLRINDGVQDVVSSDGVIVSEFQSIFNELIRSGVLRLKPQYGPPYYLRDGHTAFVDDNYINIEGRIPIDSKRDFFERYVMIKMKSTKRKYVLLTALKNGGYMQTKKGEYQRQVDVHFSEDEHQKVLVYSFSRSLLNKENMERLYDCMLEDYFFSASDIPKINFVPLITNKRKDRVAGIQITPESDANFHMFVSGKTGFGKSFFLAQQALFRINVSDKVIIFDNNGSFTPDELKKHLSQDVIDEHVSFFDVGSELPVDLLSVEECRNNTEKGEFIYSVLSAGNKGFGKNQETIVYNSLFHLFKDHEEKTKVTVMDILACFDEKDPIKKTIKEKIENMLFRLKDMNVTYKSWHEFLNAQKSIVVLSMGADTVFKGTQMVDMLLTSLYNYKVNHKENRYTVIVDEIKDLNLSNSGPINVMLRKGRKQKIVMLLASQEYSDDNGSLDNVVDNVGARVFFRPKNEHTRSLANKYGIEEDVLRKQQTGICFVDADFYRKTPEHDCHAFIHGLTAEYCTTDDVIVKLEKQRKVNVKRNVQRISDNPEDAQDRDSVSNTPNKSVIDMFNWV